MTAKRIIELLTAEYNCVARNSAGCNRDCANCDLVQDDQELLQMYKILINFITRLREYAQNEKLEH